MFLGFVGAIAGGLSLAALLLIISKVTRIELPRWLYPAVAGLGMLFLTVYIEYSWFERTRAELPADVEVVQTFSRTSFYQPWSYLLPRIDRFIAVDHASVRRNETLPNVVLLDVFLLERLSPSLVATQFIQCATGERLLVGEDTALGADGLPLDQDWAPLGTDHPIVSTVCTRQSLPVSGTGGPSATDG